MLTDCDDSNCKGKRLYYNYLIIMYQNMIQFFRCNDIDGNVTKISEK